MGPGSLPLPLLRQTTVLYEYIKLYKKLSNTAVSAQCRGKEQIVQSHVRACRVGRKGSWFKSCVLFEPIVCELSMHLRPALNPSSFNPCTVSFYRYKMYILGPTRFFFFLFVFSIFCFCFGGSFRSAGFRTWRHKSNVVALCSPK